LTAATVVGAAAMVGAEKVKTQEMRRQRQEQFKKAATGFVIRNKSRPTRSTHP
jgi:hypothetical protein